MLRIVMISYPILSLFILRFTDRINTIDGAESVYAITTEFHAPTPAR